MWLLIWTAQGMQSMENIDFENDWKMISLQIGGNDQCKSCLNPDIYTPDNFELYVDAAIQKIQDTIPKVVVSLIDQFIVSEVYKVIVKNNRCVGHGAVSKYFHCPCALVRKNMDPMKTLAEGTLSLFATSYSNSPLG